MRQQQGQRSGISFKTLITLAATLTIGAMIMSLGCNTSADTEASDADTVTNYPVATLAAVQNGKVLSETYCRSCHQYPSPGLLNRNKWKAVLPQMGLRLGIKQHGGFNYTPTINNSDFTPPAKPLLSHAQWQNILDYYLNTAPLQLPAQNRTVDITRDMPFFSLKTPAKQIEGGQVLGTYVKIDNTVKPARVFVANGRANKLYLLSNKLRVLDSVNTGGPVVDMLFDKNAIYVCTIGKELGANSDKLGVVTGLKIGSSGKMLLDATPLFNKLARPVKVLAADINGDGKTDYLICEFGAITGGLCWMENHGGGTFTKHVISSLPGAIKAYFEYLPGKTTPDVWVLFAQGQEGIYHYTNNGAGQFKEAKVLSFPPVYGSSFFDRVDVDGDGYKDIVYTCGDNGDATNILKPYHGVYIFLNDKHGNYQQRYFYPINGCYKAIARDFDGNGTVDIATISLFTDAKQPAEGFVYLKNTGGLNFKPYSLPANIKFERGVTLDDGDLDNDGRPDLLIGNAFFDFGPFKANVKESLFLMLQNRAGVGR